MAMFRELTEKTAGLRRPGAASLDLAYVACGRYDAFFEFGLNPWDFAAGVLMVQEAGGLVSDFQGESGYEQSGDIVAGNPKVFAQLIPLLGKHLQPAADESAE
jgi:myo-inositol-1(or 4)-monophosphatase